MVEGKNTDDLLYVMEIEDNSHLFACYLLSIFGDFTEGYRSEGHRMAGNAEVMDLWARFSSESMNEKAAEEHLMMAFEHVKEFVCFFRVHGPNSGVSED